MGGKKPPPLGYHRVPIWGTIWGTSIWGGGIWWCGGRKQRKKSSMSISKNKKLKSIV